MKPTSLHTLGLGVVALDSFIVPDRLRRESSDPGLLQYIQEQLAPSIAAHGLIQPITLNITPEPVRGKNLQGVEIESDKTLVAGWCRSMAFKYLKHDFIPFGTREALAEHDRHILELEENLWRRAMTFLDKCRAVCQIHNERKAANIKEGKVKWGTRQTGHLLGVAAGEVSELLQVQALLDKGDKELADCKNLTDARRILARRASDAAHAILIQRQGVKPVASKSSNGAPKKVQKDAGPASGLKIDLLPSRSKVEPQRKAADERPKFEVTLSDKLYHIDCHEWFAQREPASVDLIYTDIPYGIDMANLEDRVNVDRVEEAHDVEENLEQMPRFLEGSFKVLKDKSYLLFWMDLKHWEKLKAWGEDVGFKVQPYPLIWLKAHPCKNQAANCHWTKAIETVMVMRKGAATLRTPQALNYHPCSGDAERKMQSNPFAKPFEFSRWLLQDTVMVPGMTMLDCYAGEGSLVRAGLNLGAKVLAVEKNELHFNRLVEHVKTYYTTTLKGDVTFV